MSRSEGASVTQTDRDYGSEVREIVDKFCVDNWTAPSVATKVVDHLITSDPDLLHGFLRMHAHGIIRDMVTSAHRSIRTYNRIQASRSVFKEAADQFEQGNEEPLRTGFLQESYALEDGSWRPLKDLRAEELSFVAGRLENQAATMAMRAAFLRALARRCGDTPVGDVFSEVQLAKLWNSLTGTSITIEA
jgi:hypothetical protein